MGSLSLTASKSTQRKGFGALLAGVEHIPYPNSYRCEHGHTSETCGAEILETLERQIFKRLFDPEEVAAIVIEPIQGEGGYISAPKFFLQELQRICRKHGIMFVVDEVQSGMGRTGKWWASDHAGIEPDILCSATGIASGMPLDALVDLPFPKGLIVLAAGATTVRLSPPLVIDEEQADFALQTLETCIREIEKKA